MNDTAFFSYSTEEDLSYVLEFSGLDLTGRDFEVKVKDRASSTTRATLTIGAGLTVTGTNVFEAAYAIGSMAGWPTGEYSADVVDVTDGAHSRIMAVRFVRALPGRLVEGVQNRKAFVRWSPNQAVVTATGAIGPAGPPGPQGEPGEQGDPGLDGADGTDGTNGTDGDNGWSPVFAVVSDGARRVLQIDDWVGGEGTKPATGDYVGASGLTPTIGDAVDIRGPAGTATIPDGDKGDITTSDSGDTWEINDNVIGDGKLRDSAALSVIGRSANSPGDPADITAGTDGYVLRRAGTALAFGTIATTGITDDAVTNAKLANMANGTLKGRKTASTGDPEDLSGADATSLLSAMVGDSGSGGTKGLVPAPAAGDATKFLAGDGTFKSAGGIVRSSAVSLTGTAVDLTGVPSGVKRVSVIFNGASLSGTDSLLVQLGTSSSVETSGYTSGSSAAVNSSAGLPVYLGNASRAASGIMSLVNTTGNTWVGSHATGNGTTADAMGGGSKSLSGTLDRVRITTTAGASFDAGTVTLFWEF